MRTITKGIEPRSLITHRLNAPSYYDNYVNKKDLRQALVNEQRALCCYCMSRISPQIAQIESMKIEHWQSQGHYPDKQLDYKNLLGACLGGQGATALWPALRYEKGGKETQMESRRSIT